MSSVFVGPITARGRNEGLLKSRWEIGRAIPLWNIVTWVHHGRLAERGVTWPEYRQILRSALNLNCFPDVLGTVDECERRGLVSAGRCRQLRRHLCQCNFLNADVLVSAVRHNAVSSAEARELLFRWLRRIGDHRETNLYVHCGNENMVRKLQEAGVISPGEAIYLLRVWVSRLDRLHASMLRDIEHFGALPETAVLALASRERHRLAEVSRLYGVELGDGPGDLAAGSREHCGPDPSVRQVQRQAARENPRPASLPAWFE